MTDVKRPRVWVICPHLGADSQPWLWRQVVGLRGLDVTVVTAEWVDPTGYPVDATVHEQPEIRVAEVGLVRWWERLKRLPRRNLQSLGATAVDELEQLAAREPPDVLLCHFGHTALKVQPLAERLAVPLVAHYHGLDLSSYLRSHRWYRWSLRRQAPRFAEHVVVGTHQAGIVERLGAPADRVHLIPCGVPTASFPWRGEEPPPPVRFIVVCRLVEWKGAHVAIEALAMVRDRGIEARLDVVGDGPERRSLEDQAQRLGLGDDAVAFHGSVSQRAVSGLLREAHIFLQHSLSVRGWVEGFGVSITEAAAIGMPVVVSDCGGIKDQVRDGVTGYIVPEGDTTMMAARMAQLATDPALRARMGEAGYGQARAEYDTVDQVAKLERVLCAAIDRWPRT